MINLTHLTLHVNLVAKVFICDLFMECAEMLGISTEKKSSNSLLHDHRSLELNVDDYQRVCRIPKKKVFVDSFMFYLPQSGIVTYCELVQATPF